MSRTEITFTVVPRDPWTDLLIAELGTIGFEAFEEDVEGVKAYIRSDRFDRDRLRAVQVLHDPHIRVDMQIKEIANTNWNAVWERSFEPILIGDQVHVRAEHHAPRKDVLHDLVIQPRMAFGTGHHATTQLMIEGMLRIDLHNKQVCDLGCGTGILAIVAERLGAARVQCWDNDQQAVDNARENVERNKAVKITVEKGDAGALAGGTFDVTLANIERNTLVDSMVMLSGSLATGGVLLLSGFVGSDRDHMVRAGRSHGLKKAMVLQRDDWVMLMMKRSE